MKITAQEEYGLRCLLRLARAGEGRALTIPEIAAAEKLSVPYVGKMMGVLRQAGLVESVRGRAGGYHLGRRPADIRLGSVLLVLGEPLFDDPGYCEQHASPEDKGRACIHHDSCTLRVLWQGLEQWMRRLLDQITLADLMQGAEQVVQRLGGNLPAAAEPAYTPLLSLATLPRG
jgi:Rrf2 family protein